MSRQRWVLVVTHITATLVGFVAAKLIGNIPFFEMRKDVDLIAIIRILVMVLVSVILYHRFERMKHSDQLKKEAILSRLQRSVDTSLETEDLVTSESIPYNQAVKLVTQSRKDFESYAAFSRALGIPVHEDELSRFQLNCAEVKDLLTNTPLRTEPEPKIRIVKGSIHLTNDRRVEVERKIVEGRQILYGLQQRVILTV